MSRYSADTAHPAAVILRKNLARLDADTAGALEARRAHLRELALALIAAPTSIEAMIDDLRGSAPQREFTPDSLPDNARFCRSAFTALSMIERIELCRMICALAPIPMPLSALLEPAEPIAEEALGRIAYLQNAFTDRAYHAFSTRTRRARSQYHDSYGAACEAVAEGSCEACILPIEHAQDGKLLGFYRLIDRYELRIVCACDIAGQNGVESRFALLQKSFALPLPERSDGYFFELSLTRSTDHTLGGLLAAASCCGLDVRRVDSIPLAYTENSFAHHAVFTTRERSLLTPFLLYLTLDIPQFEPIGIYPLIHE